MDYMHLSQYQKDLYKEKHIVDKESRTYCSNVFQNGPDASIANNTATSSDNSREENVKTPWGRSRSYAGDGPINLPTDHRPKCEPPPVLQRTHQHFGSGLFPHPRGYPFVQYYDLTQLKKSNLRSSDELVPRPSTSEVHDKEIQVSFPQEHPFSSHMCRQEIFPTVDTPVTVDALNTEKSPSPEPIALPSLVPVPSSTIVVQKVMGNFARREIYTPPTSTLRQPLVWTPKKIERLQIQSPWFSRHEVMTQFNKQYPTTIPRIELNIQKKKQPNWLAHCSVTI